MAAPNYAITESDGQTVITIRRKSNWLALLISGAWSIGWVIITATVVYGVLSDPSKLDGGLLLFLGCFSVIGLVVLDRFLWYLWGREMVTIDGNQVRIKRIGILFALIKRFETDQIDGIAMAEENATPEWIRFWGIGGGRIAFRYYGHTRHFGQGLTALEAKQIIDRLNTLVKATAH